MKYTLKEDKIIINCLDDFNISDILECGQVFRYKKINEFEYEVFSKDKKALVKQNNIENNAIIYTNDVEYFKNYFDLDTDYNKIKLNLKKYNLKFLNDAINKFGGIRILNQDIFETFISFVISSNNNIKRIQSIIEKLCEKFGSKINDYYAFPTFKQLINANENDFREIGLGYRTKYFIKIFQQLKENDLNNLYFSNEKDIKKQLLSFCGIGNKVADCIMLFGYKKSTSFPVDVWIQRMYNEYFDKDEKDREIISTKLVEKFGNLSGYAQQYLFHYIRVNKTLL